MTDTDLLSQKTAGAEPWVLAGQPLSSRLILGTGGVQSLEVLRRVIDASATALTTVAMRRVSPDGGGSLLGTLREAGVRILPNTAGCHTASEARLVARLGREALGTDWVKLEVVADDHTLLPDPVELRDAALIASAITRAADPERMATAMRLAVAAGHAARTAGRIPRRWHARASSPVDGRPELPE